MAQFKGFKQVTHNFFSGVTDSEKIGYLWFVRSSADGEPFAGDIYLGTMHYGHYGTEVDDLDAAVSQILEDAGIIDESGNTVDVASLIQEAQLEAGDAISIENQTVSVKVADETTNAVDDKSTNKNFVKINENNELEVKGVDTDATVTTEDITIAGGPLASIALQAYPSGILPSGTSIQDILKALLCVEIWDNPSVSYTFTTTTSNPTINFNKSGSSFPVGTSISLSATHGTSSAQQKAVASGFGSTGYFSGDTAVEQASYTQNVTPTASGDYELQASFTGFKNLDGTSVAANSGESTTVYISQGTNTYSVNESGLTYTPATFSDVTLYDRSNLNGKSETPIVISEENFESSSAYAASKMGTSSLSRSVTGYYPIYYGTIATTNATDATFTESVIKGFGNTHNSVPSSVTTPANTGAFAIAIPEGNSNYSKSSISMIDSKDMAFGASHNFATTITMENNFETKNYKVFYITNANATSGSANWTLSFS